MSERQLIAESQKVLAHHARSFRWGQALLPTQMGDDAAVVYAFCRLVDDTVDEAASVEEGARELEALREAWKAPMRSSHPARALVQRFADLVAHWGIPEAAVDALFDGVGADAGRVRIATRDELIRYSYRVAGTVGLFMCGVLGVRDPRAFRHAIDLGIGMQLTNICRDVAEDLTRDRVYLPRDLLEAAGVDVNAMDSGALDQPGIARVVGDLLDLADRYYASADAGMRYIPWRGRLAIMAAARIYRAIGLVIRRRGCDVTKGRAYVSWPEKTLWLVGSVVATLTLRSAPHAAELHQPLLGLPGAGPTRPALVAPPTRQPSLA